MDEKKGFLPSMLMTWDLNVSSAVVPAPPPLSAEEEWKHFFRPTHKQFTRDVLVVVKTTAGHIVRNIALFGNVADVERHRQQRGGPVKKNRSDRVSERNMTFDPKKKVCVCVC